MHSKSLLDRIVCFFLLDIASGSGSAACGVICLLRLNGGNAGPAVAAARFIPEQQTQGRESSVAKLKKISSLVRPPSSSVRFPFSRSATQRIRTSSTVETPVSTCLQGTPFVQDFRGHSLKTRFTRTPHGLRILFGTANPALAQDISCYLGLELGKIKIKRDSIAAKLVANLLDHVSGQQQQLIRDGFEEWTSFITKVCHLNLIHEYYLRIAKQLSCCEKVTRDLAGQQLPLAFNPCACCCWCRDNSWLLRSIHVQLATGAEDNCWILRSIHVLAAGAEEFNLQAMERAIQHP
ncbi:PREDICTED: uncharacterized protein LOC104789473 [Camelina sativa]|uniref:Uncharacterized protein LOC104789473 n=1 Tax=Camelina sativa TaxID=90675 RepID=A0ABM1RPG1_CAMSA|nr:PREDICTED: uncharacterized protein LOC104789473 [Camelina sativa]